MPFLLLSYASGRAKNEKWPAANRNNNPTNVNNNIGSRIADVPEAGSDFPAVSEWGLLVMALLYGWGTPSEDLRSDLLRLSPRASASWCGIRGLHSRRL